jgi:uncharacterized linocin/CFP29 family protein
MNHLLRELAPISDEAWEQIDAEARRSLKHFLAARRLIDFNGPLGWKYSSLGLGRIELLSELSAEGVVAARRKALPVVEFRAPFSLSSVELAAAERGATDLDLSAVIAASRSAALAEDGAIFHGYEAGGISGIVPSSPHEAITISDDYAHYPAHVAKAVDILRDAGVAGPYSIAMGARGFTGVIETTEHGGYPVFEHLRNILGGDVIWAPAVDGAIIVSQRGGDFEMTVGQDFSIGYSSADADAVELYIEESFSLRINTPEAAIHLAHR